MSNVIVSAGWKGCRREAVVGWVALTGGAILFAVVATVVSRLGVGRDPAMAIALMVAGPAAVWSLLWILESGVTNGKSIPRWKPEFQLYFSYFTALMLILVALMLILISVDYIYPTIAIAIAAACMLVDLVLQSRQWSRFTRECTRWEAIRHSETLAAIRKLEQ
jgi:signal transduction histidine kinase